MNVETHKTVLDSSHAAISAFLRRATVPLFSEHQGPTALYGCGTLFADHGRYFLVTATHVLEAVPNAEFGIPIADGNSEVWTISARQAAKAPTDEEDVSVVELSGKILEKFVEGGYRRFFGPENVDESEPEVFVAFGYRLGDVKHSASAIGAQPTMISARRYQGRTDDVNVKVGRHDLLLEWQHDLSLRGISGSPLWAVKPADASKIWSPELSMKLVGVQTGAVAKTWIRGTRWRVARALIDRLVRGE